MPNIVVSTMIIYVDANHITPPLLPQLILILLVINTNSFL